MMRQFISSLKRRFPRAFQRIFRWRDALFNIPGRLQLARFQKGRTDFAMAYLSPRFPGPPASRHEFAHGGAVKLTYLAEALPHHFPAANLIYAVSSVGHPLQMEILARAKRMGLKIIVNQNGVAFPAWAGAQYETFNDALKRLIRFADFVVYQSQFCRDSAERYISPPDVPQEIIYNPVDTAHFSPKDIEKPAQLTLLLGGNQYEQYRLQLALQTLHSLLDLVPNARLIVTGNLWRPAYKAQEWTARALEEMGLAGHVEFVGRYTQADAPYLYSRAHILLHTKYADPCPGLVLEALGCGLPVVHVGNGGVPELVEDAGIGVPVAHSWEEINLPEPRKMAEAILQVYDNLEHYSQAARHQALKFPLDKFITRHIEIFDLVLASTP